MLKTGGKSRTQLQHPTDRSLTSLGYWTDNGAWYHYLCSECCGGGGGSQGPCDCPPECAGHNTMEDVMLGVKKDWASKKIPAKYFMFDSWWYPKEGDPESNSTVHPWPVRSKGGVKEWIPEPQVFPSGLTNWLGLPTFLHNRCFATDNVYLAMEQFQDSFSCNSRLCIPTDVEVFKHIMGVVQPWQPFVYEQDWISEASNAEFVYNSTWLGAKWLTAMNDGARYHNMTVQYSMTMNAALLQSTTLGAVTQVRGSSDYTAGSDSWDVGGTSLFYWALGVVASKDTFFTTPHQPGCPKPGLGNCTEPNVEMQIITSVLSHGPVGPGDRLGMTDPVLTLRSCNADGAILRPRAPFAPLESVFTADDFSANHALLPWGATVGAASSPDAFVVFHSDAVSGLSPNATVTVQELAALPGATLHRAGPAPRYVAALITNGTAWENGGGVIMSVVEAGAPLVLTVGAAEPPRKGANALELWLLAPIDPTGGWALLGELGKVVPHSAQRVAHSGFVGGGQQASVTVRATIVGVPGESVVITAVDSTTMATHDATCVFTAAATEATFQCKAQKGCACH